MPTPSELRVHPLTSAVGAVIEGVDLCQLQKPETLHGIRQALREHGVVFFRGQDDVTVQQLWEFLRPFGTPQVEDSFGSDDDVPEQVETADFQLTKGGTAVWHADSTFLARPPKITLLRMVKTPPWGGDTCWASMSAAYEALSEPVRELLDGLSAIHSIDPPLSRLGDFGEGFGAAFLERHARQQVHPVVAVHAETGRRALFVTESCTTRIVELEPAESRHLLRLLFDHVRSPDFAMRWSWSPHDVALWDNRSVQHYAVPDYTSERLVHRIIVAGERPVGPGEDGARR